MAKAETLIDTGLIVGALNPSDQYHGWARKQLAQHSPPFFTCEAVLSESFHILEEEATATERLLQFLERGAVEAPFSYAANAEHVHALMRTYADQPMSFADACLVKMCEARRSAQVFTTDGDFHVYRTGEGEALDVLGPPG